MAPGLVLRAWALTAAWSLAWEALRPRGRRRREDRWRAPARPVGEALALTLLAALWFGSLGAGEWWLVFALLGTSIGCPARAAAPGRRSRPGAALGLAGGVVRIVVAGGVLAWRLG